MDIKFNDFSHLANADADSHETPSRPAKGSQADRRIDIQPAEDEEGDYNIFCCSRSVDSKFNSFNSRSR